MTKKPQHRLKEAVSGFLNEKLSFEDLHVRKVGGGEVHLVMAVRIL